MKDERSNFSLLTVFRWNTIAATNPVIKGYCKVIPLQAYGAQRVLKLKLLNSMTSTIGGILKKKNRDLSMVCGEKKVVHDREI
jgi:hypothetical protein